MHLFKKKASPRKIAVTGASGGIGAAIAEQYARRFGSALTLYLTGRKLEELDRVASICRSFGAEVDVYAFDQREKGPRTAWLESLVARGVHTLILGAGVSASVEVFPKESERPLGYIPEKTSDLERELTVNGLLPVLLANEFARRSIFREAADPGPMERVRIGFIASLAGLTGLPGSPGYSASKAMLRTYGEALRRLAEDGGRKLKPRISVTVLFPGFVESAMSERYLGAQPGRISASEAALKMMRAIEKGKAECAFPFYLAWGISLLNLLPLWLQRPFLKSFFFTVEPDQESRWGRPQNKSRVISVGSASSDRYAE